MISLQKLLDKGFTRGCTGGVKQLAAILPNYLRGAKELRIYPTSELDALPDVTASNGSGEDYVLLTKE